MKNILLFTFFVAMLFASCHNKSQSENAMLIQAETLMSQYPDSALTVLQSVAELQQLSHSEYALWCLLLTQAQDKCYIPHTTDSLINQSVQYFENTTDRFHYGMALYYKARIYQDLRRQEEAAALFLKAKDEIEPLKEYKTLFLIATHLGSLYAYQGMPVEAMAIYQDAYNYAVLNNDSSSMSFGLSFIGRIHGLNDEWEKTIDSYAHAINIATTIRDTFALRLALNEQTSAYVQIEHFEEASNNMKRLESIMDKGKGSDIYTSYIRIGTLYQKQNHYKEAIPYFEKALQSPKLQTLRSANHSLSFLYESLGDYKKAIDYHKQYQFYKDSIGTEKYQQSLQELNKKYETEKLQNLNSKLNWRRKQNLFIFINISLLLIIIIYYFYLLIIRKNKKLLFQKHEIENYKWQIKKNQKIIEENTSRITILSEEIETKRIDKNHIISEKYQDLIMLKKQLLVHNKELTRQNRMYSRELEKLKTTSIIDKDKTESNSNIITRLKNKPVMLYDRDWEDIKLLLNLADHNFIIRLSESHPDLTADDIKYCCLFKLKFSITDIAIMMNVQSSTVSKRKLRIKNHLNPNELKNQLLEDYLYLF